MTEPTLLFAQQHDDGGLFRTTAVGGTDGMEIHNERTDAEGFVSRWGRRYEAAAVAMIVGLLGGTADDLGDPVRFLHRMAVEGDLPPDQPLDGWLADHGIPGEAADLD